MSLNQVLAAFELVIEYGVNNPTTEQIARQQNARRIIRAHYRMDRDPTGFEIRDEINNLLRKHKAGTLDDRQHFLAAKLDLFRS
jgi:hypothetical protein